LNVLLVQLLNNRLFELLLIRRLLDLKGNAELLGGLDLAPDHRGVQVEDGGLDVRVKGIPLPMRDHTPNPVPKAAEERWLSELPVGLIRQLPLQVGLVSVPRLHGDAVDVGD